MRTSLSRTIGTRTTGAALSCLLVAALALLAAPPTHAQELVPPAAALADAARAGHGLPPLVQVAALEAVALQQAQAMADRGGLFHTPALGERVDDWERLAENVGQGADVEAVHAALMASPAHRANLLDPRLSEVGVGVVASGGRVWVSQVFRQPTAAPAGTTPPPLFVRPAFCAGAPAAPFVDVRRNAWYAGAVDCAVDVGLVSGVTPTGYAPERPLTRAQLASLLHRVVLRSSSAAAVAGAPDVFADVAGSPHERAVNALAGLGVVRGTAPGRYDPQGQVTRVQATSMLVRLRERLAGPLPTTGASFADVARSVHAEAVDKAVSAGIASGTTPTTFAPAAPVRRDVGAVLLVRTYSGLRDAGAVR